MTFPPSLAPTASEPRHAPLPANTRMQIPNGGERATMPAVLLPAVLLSAVLLPAHVRGPASRLGAALDGPTRPARLTQRLMQAGRMRAIDAPRWRQSMRRKQRRGWRRGWRRERHALGDASLCDPDPAHAADAPSRADRLSARRDLAQPRAALAHRGAGAHHPRRRRRGAGGRGAPDPRRRRCSPSVTHAANPPRPRSPTPPIPRAANPPRRRGRMDDG
jgi:hypothetical protein